MSGDYNNKLISEKKHYPINVKPTIVFPNEIMYLEGCFVIRITTTPDTGLLLSTSNQTADTKPSHRCNNIRKSFLERNMEFWWTYDVVFQLWPDETMATNTRLTRSKSRDKRLRHLSLSGFNEIDSDHFHSNIWFSVRLIRTRVRLLSLCNAFLYNHWYCSICSEIRRCSLNNGNGHRLPGILFLVGFILIALGSFAMHFCLLNIQGIRGGNYKKSQSQASQSFKVTRARFGHYHGKKI